MSHTAKPWERGPDPMVIIHPEEEHGSYSVIATVDVDLLSGDADANAQLIVAAPDLLEALCLAEGVIAWVVDHGAQVQSILDIIHAAISKAIGEPDAREEVKPLESEHPFLKMIRLNLGSVPFETLPREQLVYLLTTIRALVTPDALEKKKES